MKFDLNPEVGREKFEFTLNIYNGYKIYKICEDFKIVIKVLLNYSVTLKIGLLPTNLGNLPRLQVDSHSSSCDFSNRSVPPTGVHGICKRSRF